MRGPRGNIAVIAAAVIALLGSAVITASSAPAALPPRPLRILVTNDDGIAAPGLATLVDSLQALPDVNVTVVAPATNQSGSGIKFTTTAFNVAPATTMSGDAATAVSGTPADTVLYGLLAANLQPDVVIAGINEGQNIGPVVDVSGTVGAGRMANLYGVPAIAVSQGLGANINYTTAGHVAAYAVTILRSQLLNHGVLPMTLNINVPTCATGSNRGAKNVPTGQQSKVTAYALQSGSIGNGTVKATVASNPFGTPDCTSTVTNVHDDIAAFRNGYITVTWLYPTLTDQKP
jgi:5'-nucleotidase